MIVKIRFLWQFLGVSKFYTLHVAVVTITTCIESFSEANSHAKVHWDLMTKPVVFDEYAILTCMVTNNDLPCVKSNNRIWEGGPSNAVLLINGHSTNSGKYEEILEYPCKKFSLVIKAFDVSDVNCSYRCSYGLTSSRQELSIDEHVFIAMPQRNTTKCGMESYKSDIEIDVELEKVYPFPNCSMFVGVNLIDKDFVIANVSKNNMFYDIKLHSKIIPIPSSCNVCGWNTSATVICSLNFKPVVNYTFILNCSVNRSAQSTRRCSDSVTRENNDSVIFSVLGIATGLIFITLTLALYRSLMLKLKSTEQMDSELEPRSSLEEEINCENEMTELKLFHST